MVAVAGKSTWVRLRNAEVRANKGAHLLLHKAANPSHHLEPIMKSFACSVTVVAVAMLTGCAATTDAVDESASDLVNKPASDVTVLSASTSGPVNGVQRAECTALPSGQFNCTQAYERRLGLPMIHEWISWNPESVQCSTLKVRTVSPAAAINQASATGIGFHYDGINNLSRFIPKSKLVEVGSVTLRSGQAAKVHEFVGFTTCWLGSGSSSANAKYTFKPYMQFEANGETFRNWDIVPNDYVIRSSIQGFDRSNELLLPTPR
jgi:hypothetical protein